MRLSIQASCFFCPYLIVICMLICFFSFRCQRSCCCCWVFCWCSFFCQTFSILQSPAAVLARVLCSFLPKAERTRGVRYSRSRVKRMLKTCFLRVTCGGRGCVPHRRRYCSFGMCLIIHQLARKLLLFLLRSRDNNTCCRGVPAWAFCMWGTMFTVTFPRSN